MSVLGDVEVFIVGNKPPYIGGKYFQFIKLTTKCGIIGYGECYAASVSPFVMTSIIKDIFDRNHSIFTIIIYLVGYYPISKCKH